MRGDDSPRERRGRSVRLGDRRGVSETIGFVFAFALVTASVGVVYTSGIGGLEDAREDEQLTNAVRAFEVLADNVADVSRRGAPSRATELKLNGASIGFGDPVIIEVQPNDSVPYQIRTRPLVYDGAAGKVVYSAGATFREDDGGAVMRVDPGFVIGEKRTVVPLLTTYPRGDLAGIGGSGTVLVVAHRQSATIEGRNVTSFGGQNVDVTITVESPRAEAWRRYFEQQAEGNVELEDGVVTYRFETDRLLVPKTTVEFGVNA